MNDRIYINKNGSDMAFPDKLRSGNTNGGNIKSG